jgi:hypothetical protein
MVTKIAFCAQTWLKNHSKPNPVLFFYYIYLAEIQPSALSIYQNPGEPGERQTE